MTGRTHRKLVALLEAEGFSAVEIRAANWALSILSFIGNPGIFCVTLLSMSRRRVSGIIFGLPEWTHWLDQRSRAIFGISGAEFEAQYAAGAFAGRGVAHDLAAILPLIVRLREHDGADRAPLTHGLRPCSVVT